MEIIKKINNNVALGRDSKNRDIVVFGKGIGFPAMPYTLTDLSRVQRTFYDVGDSYLNMLKATPGDILLVASDIAEEAAEELDCPLNPNLPFLLADHLNFAVERCREGLNLTTPLAYDVRHLYPQEYALGRKALTTLQGRLGVTLPESEAVSITLHLISAEAETADFHATMVGTKIISELSDEVERYFSIRLDKESFNYSRFAMHLRYLVQRMIENKPAQPDATTREMFNTMRREYPEIYGCVLEIDKYFKTNWKFHCTTDEQMYLMMHINRVKAAVNAGNKANGI